MRCRRFRQRTAAVYGICFLVISICATGCVFVSTKGLLTRGVQPFEETVLFGTGKDKILVVEVEGLISERESSKPFQIQVEPNMVASVKEQLDKAARDGRIKGLLLMINSPGGTVSASDLLYDEVRQFKEAKGVRVAALLNGTATSGAYYVAQAADRIFAYPTTVTGSIGVVLLNINLNGLMEKVGVTNATVKSGQYKDLGSPLRKPEEGEVEILQDVVSELHARFVAVVAANRTGTDLVGRADLTDGRIFTARQALSNGLIDEIGYVADAVQWVRGEAAVPDARVVRYQRRGEYLPTLYSYGQAPAPRAEINLIKLDVEGLLSGSGPTFMYLWMPGE